MMILEKNNNPHITENIFICYFKLAKKRQPARISSLHFFIHFELNYC